MPAERAAAMADYRRRCEAVVADMVLLNLAKAAAALPVGDRLAISHFALTASVSALALEAHRRANAMARYTHG